MDRRLLDVLTKITDEEREILKGKNIEQNIYTSSKDFTIDSRKMLKKGQMIDIRTHTRFVHFPKHRHDYIEIIYMCNGSTTHIINNDTKIELEKGNLLFLNQHAYHEIEPALENDIAINFMVLPQFFDIAFNMLEGENVLKDFIVDSLCTDTSKADYLYFRVAEVLPIQNLIENMIWSIVNKQNNEGKINQTTMGLLLMTLLNYTDKIEKNSSLDYDNAITMAVLKYIEENYKTATLTYIAGELNQSIYKLSRIIKQGTGYTFKELLQIKRFGKSVELLKRTKLPVSDIISYIGYDNTSYFYRIFREKYNMTPNEFRDLEQSN